MADESGARDSTSAQPTFNITVSVQTADGKSTSFQTGALSSNLPSPTLQINIMTFNPGTSDCMSAQPATTTTTSRLADLSDTISVQPGATDATSNMLGGTKTVPNTAIAPNLSTTPLVVSAPSPVQPGANITLQQHKVAITSRKQKNAGAQEVKEAEAASNPPVPGYKRTAAETAARRIRDRKNYATHKNDAAQGDADALAWMKKHQGSYRVHDARRHESINLWTEEEVSFLLSALVKHGSKRDKDWEFVAEEYAALVQPTENLRSRSIVELKAKAKELKCDHLDRGEELPDGLHDVKVVWPRPGDRIQPEDIYTDEEVQDAGIAGAAGRNTVVKSGSKDCERVQKDLEEKTGLNMEMPVVLFGTLKRTSRGMEVQRM